MGELTCPVLLAFLFLHVAIIFLAIGIGTPYWVEGSSSNHTTNSTNSTTNSSSIKCHMGLWERCIDGDCKHLQKPPGWHQRVEILQPIACGLVLLAASLYYCVLLCQRCAKPFRNMEVATFFLLVAAALSIAAQVLCGTNYDGKFMKEMTGDCDMELGWSFYVAAVGSLFTLCAFVCSVCVLRIQKKILNRRGYEDI